MTTNIRHQGRPQLNTVSNKGAQRWQQPVYATEREARVSGSGWLYWVNCDPPHQNPASPEYDPAGVVDRA